MKMQEGKRFAVSIEICHILDKQQAERLAEQIRNRLCDISEDVYVCISEYEQVQKRSTLATINATADDLSHIIKH